MEDARELVEKLDAVMTEMEAAEVKLLMTIPFQIQRYYLMGIILFFIIITTEIETLNSCSYLSHASHCTSGVKYQTTKS